MIFYPYMSRYGVLAPKAAAERDPKIASERVCDSLEKSGKLKPEEFMIGHTKVRGVPLLDRSIPRLRNIDPTFSL